MGLRCRLATPQSMTQNKEQRRRLHSSGKVLHHWLYGFPHVALSSLFKRLSGAALLRPLGATAPPSCPLSHTHSLQQRSGMVVSRARAQVRVSGGSDCSCGQRSVHTTRPSWQWQLHRQVLLKWAPSSRREPLNQQARALATANKKPGISASGTCAPRSTCNGHGSRCAQRWQRQQQLQTTLLMKCQAVAAAAAATFCTRLN